LRQITLGQLRPGRQLTKQDHFAQLQRRVFRQARTARKPIFLDDIYQL
jgi:hypothetical protein